MSKKQLPTPKKQLPPQVKTILLYAFVILTCYLIMAYANSYIGALLLAVFTGFERYFAGKLKGFQEGAEANRKIRKPRQPKQQAPAEQ